MLKRFVLPVVVAILFSSPNLASTNTAVSLVTHKHSGSKIQTQTKSVLVRVVSRTKKQLLVINSVIDADDPELPGNDEIDLHTVYARPRITKKQETDDELSDYVKVRLALAREKALEKYREKWA
jgi:exosome complex RNA-binding protein Csl4